MEEDRRSSLSSVDLMGGTNYSLRHSSRSMQSTATSTPFNQSKGSSQKKGCLSSLWRCLTCPDAEEADMDSTRNAPINTTTNRLHTGNNVSTDGVSLPDMSIYSPDCEVEEDLDAELRNQFDDDDCGEDGLDAALNPGLDNDIKAYEKAIADYEELEETSRVGLGTELAAVIADLRRDPDSFAHSPNPAIQALARVRATVYSSKARLGIADHINYDSSGRKRAKSFTLRTRTDIFGDSPEKEASTNPKQRMNKRASWQVGTASNGMTNSFDPKAFSMSVGAVKSAASSSVDDSQQIGSDKDENTEKLREDSALSKKLSTRWAERLIDVNPTRGKLRESGLDEHGVQTFKIRPQWPEWLVDTSYTVVKRNKYGKKQKRMIKLTEHHFFNIKKGREITQTFLYGEMQNVWLKNQTTLLVSFGEDRIYEYLTDIAPLIAQQLATRVQVRNALDKASSGMLTGQSSVANYSKSTAAMITSIKEGSSSGGPSSLISFARTISESFLNEREHTDRGSSMWHRDADGVVDDAALAQRLIHILPNSPEMLISAAVQDIMFDVRAPEGNTRRVFIEKFLGYETEGPEAVDSKTMCTELRHFIGDIFFLSMQLIFIVFILTILCRRIA